MYSVCIWRGYVIVGECGVVGIIETLMRKEFLDSSMNTKRIGDISELNSITTLVENGYDVSLPYGEDTRYDLIIDDDGDLLKAQVKSGKYRDGVVIASLQMTRYNSDGSSEELYSSDDVGVFIVYCSDNDECYWIDMDEAEGLTKIRLRIDPTKNGQEKGIRWAEDYRI